ncbi:hypothetical protein FDB50_15415 [Clostridium botulinum]|uniref:Uncharacterized protein n=1 Tax=Clostridium botulinum TaxID=1491 RepID=A0A846JXK4_CLOBO|nr:hypothetical protein [Clostridium botulinum]NFN06092.1 hypothetical protein [Clostridium botulinum]NFN36428.1 hypothetical protein [Clostridium botulinum]
MKKYIDFIMYSSLITFIIVIISIPIMQLNLLMFKDIEMSQMIIVSISMQISTVIVFLFGIILNKKFMNYKLVRQINNIINTVTMVFSIIFFISLFGYIFLDKFK